MPEASENQWNITRRPARSCGSGSAERWASRVVSMELAASTTRSPDSLWPMPRLSTQLTPVTLRPLKFTFTTIASARSSAPERSASRRGASAPTRARIGHPYPEQKPQLLHRGRPWYTTELMAMGARKGCRPTLRQPSDTTSEEYSGGPAGIGRALERGAWERVGESGNCEMSPATPIRASTRS